MLVAACIVGFGVAAAADVPPSARRTGQSDTDGPAGVGAVHVVTVPEAQAVDTPPVFHPGDGHLVFGTWGVLRSNGAEDPKGWDKFDGAVHHATADALGVRWALDPVPMCYAYDRRRDDACNAGAAMTFLHGTLQASLAWAGDVLVVGRGDGKVYALDADSGARRWTFATSNPVDPADPDGGGEILGGPLVHAGVVYFATSAEGPYETNAVYAVDLATGALRWRWPATEAGTTGPFLAPLALSPDGTRVYAAMSWSTTVPLSEVLAFDTGNVADPLVWRHPSVDPAVFNLAVGPTALAVGADGTLYVGGSRFGLDGGVPSAYALRDDGTSAALAWPSVVTLSSGHTVGGLALREVDGAAEALYVASSTFAVLDTYAIDGGALHALAPADGSALWPAPFDPSDHGADGGMGPITLGADGALYVAATGVADHGTVFGLTPEGAVRWSLQAEGLVERAGPTLGPQGQLAFGDTARCAQRLLPIEDGACPNTDARLYVVEPGAPPVDTGDTGDTAGDTAAPVDSGAHTGGGWLPHEREVHSPSGCGCGVGRAPGGFGLLAALAVFSRARRRPASPR